MRSFPLPTEGKGRISQCLQEQPLVYRAHIKHSTYPKSERAGIHAVDVYPCRRGRETARERGRERSGPGHGQRESAPFPE